MTITIAFLENKIIPSGLHWNKKEEKADDRNNKEILCHLVPLQHW
jgi:hypothetical protein